MEEINPSPFTHTILKVMYYAHATIPIHATERKSVLLVLGCKLLCYPPREGWWERSDSGKFNANECSRVALLSARILWRLLNIYASPLVGRPFSFYLLKFWALKKKQMHLTHFPGQTREKVRGQIGHATFVLLGRRPGDRAREPKKSKHMKCVSGLWEKIGALQRIPMVCNEHVERKKQKGLFSCEYEA